MLISKIKKVIKWIIISLLLLIVIINITLIAESKLNNNKIPDIFGFTPFIIVSGSMEPNIPVDNIIITKKARAEDIKVGDVISFKDKNEDIVITHRVVEVKNLNGIYFYKTKGDSNSSADQNLVPYSQIQGKYILKIPFLGKLITYVRTPRGMTLVLTFVICIYVLYDIAEREIIRNRHKQRALSKIKY